MNISQMQRVSWEIADEKGWHDEPRTVGDQIALMHSELSEALEDFRAGRATKEIYNEYRCGIEGPHDPEESCDHKPCGVGVELADCVIRIMDFCEEEGIHLDHLLDIKTKYNRTRSRRHGGKAL